MTTSTATQSPESEKKHADDTPCTPPDHTQVPAEADTSEPLSSEGASCSAKKPEETNADLPAAIEALIFTSHRPIALRQLGRITGATTVQLREAIDALQARYCGGVSLVEIAGGYQFRSHPAQARWVQKITNAKPQRLTRPMLETLAIVAYRQPVTRPEVDDIRGVDCGNTLRTLLERKLLRIVGKKDEPGRPLLYGTSKYFLEFFGLNNLRALPPLREFAELSEEHQAQVLLRFGEEEIEGDAPPPGVDRELDRPGDSELGLHREEAGTAGCSPATDTSAKKEQQQARDTEKLREDERLLTSLDGAISRAGQVLDRAAEDNLARSAEAQRS